MVINDIFKQTLRVKEQIHLYYCYNDSETEMYIYRSISYNECKSWSEPALVVQKEGYSAVINNGVKLLANGRIAIPVYHYHDVSFAFDPTLPPQQSTCFLFYSDDNGVTWGKSSPDIVIDGMSMGGMEPAIVKLKENEVLISMRVEKGNYQYFARSFDNGATFQPYYKSNLNSSTGPVNLINLPSGQFICIHNLYEQNAHYPYRNKLIISQSIDNGDHWKQIYCIADDPKSINTYAYPSATFRDNRLIISYWAQEPTFYSLKHLNIHIDSIGLN